MANRTRQFIVTLDVPPDVPMADMGEFISQAVRVWSERGLGTQIGFDKDSVKVKYVPTVEPMTLPKSKQQELPGNKELRDLLNKKVEELAMLRVAETESLVARFIVETGLKASEIELVERHDPANRRVVIYPQKKEDK